MTGWITVTVLDTKGSAPRDAGTQMHVSATDQKGTIGGGALEFEATRIARTLLSRNADGQRQTFALGPSLGQCCGGSVTLEFTRSSVEEPKATPVWIWGAGHVGRAIASTLAPFEDRDIVLIDDHADRMPKAMPSTIDPLIAADMPTAAKHAPHDAHHLILTYSHDIDLALCDALLHRGFASCGLIGSATKWARFRTRLRQMGHSDDQIDSIICPIGDRSLGKHPQAIAIGVTMAIVGLGTKNGGASGDEHTTSGT